MIEARGLTARRGAKVVLKDLHFVIGAGEFVSIVGPNGAGKTTLLKCLMRIVPCGGEVALSGKRLSDYRQRALAQRVAFVPQAERAAVNYRAADFVLMGRYAYSGIFGRYTSDDRDMAKRALERVGAVALAERRLKELSAGERQRVYLAGAVAQGAAVVLLDEPATFLDPSAEDEVYGILAELRRESQLTVLMVTHDLNRAALSSTRVMGMKDGAIVFDGAPRALMQQEILTALFGTTFEFVPHPKTGATMILPGNRG